MINLCTFARKELKMAETWKAIAFEDDVITKALLTTEGDIIYASSASTPARLGIGSNDDVLTLAGGVPSWAAPAVAAAHKDLHDPEDGSDALDTAVPNALLEVQAQAEGTAHSFARSDHDHAIVHDITDNSIVTVDGTPSDTEIAVWNADGLEGETPAVVAARMALDDIGVPDALVDFNGQQITQFVIQNVADDAAKTALTAVAGNMVWQLDDTNLYFCTVGE